MVGRIILPSPDFTNVVTEIKVDVDRACLAICIKPEPIEIGFARCWWQHIARRRCGEGLSRQRVLVHVVIGAVTAKGERSRFLHLPGGRRYPHRRLSSQSLQRA